MTTPPLGERFRRALKLAFELHAGQTRKGSGVPYFGHLLGVTSIVLETGASEDEAIAALLHDAAEDQGGRETLERIRDEFGEAVADIVESCSDSLGEPKPPWRERKRAYLEHLDRASEPALRVSLADKLHNVRTIVVDYRELGEALWERFNAERDDVLGYYRALAGIFSRRMPGALATELSLTVTELEGLVAAVSPASASPKTHGMSR
ncbi:MAG TPA: HD domain-containing protein [Solirubrobacterales bacterium]|nr:HD domain-containing protein [Solirubrobacterales bacterium]